MESKHVGPDLYLFDFVLPQDFLNDEVEAVAYDCGFNPVLFKQGEKFSEERVDFDGG